MPPYACDPTGGAFAPSYVRIAETVAWLGEDQTGGMTHSEIESRLHADGLAIMRQLLQDSLDLRAAREQRLAGVTDAQETARTVVEHGHDRYLATIFGTVVVERLAYRGPGAANLHPADAVLNLPTEKHSHGVRRLAAQHAARVSFRAATAVIGQTTGLALGKRQVEQLTVRAAVDTHDFYALRRPAPAPDTDTLVMTFDGKGVVMHPKALRPGTANQAASRKLSTRLSAGEKRCRKRMAEVAAVYDATPVPRTVTDILPDTPTEPHRRRPHPVAAGKWLTASITDDTATVIAQGFAEATRRDPDHRRTWIALVDGNSHQIDRIRAEARRHQATVTIIIDLIHVIEYVWKAAWCFHPAGDPAAETWVRTQVSKILQGQAGIVAAAIRRKATYHGLDPTQRAGADTCAGYLMAKKPYLDYPTALTAGWPIATGVIEGACRHLVKDRMDLTGARWGLDSAEAVLRLRAITANGDFNAYWTFHLTQEQQRNHKQHYKDGVIPTR